MGLLGWSTRKEKFLPFGCRDLNIQYIVYGRAAILKSTWANSWHAFEIKGIFGFHWKVWQTLNKKEKYIINKSCQWLRVVIPVECECDCALMWPAYICKFHSAYIWKFHCASKYNKDNSRTNRKEKSNVISDVIMHGYHLLVRSHQALGRRKY